MRGTLSTTRGRRNVSRGLLGALAVALALSGVALARGDIRKRSPHALESPAIHLAAPSSVTASSLYPIKVSGYFNIRTRSARHPGANVAFVAGTDHSVHCNLKALTNPRLGFMQVAGGPSDRKLRASKPRHFSTKEEVRGPHHARRLHPVRVLPDYPTATASCRWPPRTSLCRRDSRAR